MHSFFFVRRMSGRQFSWARALGVVILATMPQACAFCTHDPINPQAQEHTTFCGNYYREGKLQEAEARCRLAREFAPKFAEPVNLLGLIELSRGHVDNARDYFKEAIALKNDFAEAHNNIGAVFMNAREYGQAADQFKEAIEIDPGYVNARVNLALCRMLQNRLDASRAEYLKCVELEPQACDCRIGLGILAVKNDQLDEARVQFLKTTDACPDNASGFYNLCQVYYDMGQCGAAMEACMKALAIKSDYMEARKNLTAATECLALEDGAIKEYIEKIKRSPGNPELHFNLGVVYHDKHLLDAALSEFLSSIKLKADYVLAYYRAARVYDEQVQAEGVIRMCKDFVERLRNDRLKDERD